MIDFYADADDLPDQIYMFAADPDAVEMPRVKRGAKPGQRPINAKWSRPTKVARLPDNWDVQELRDRLEYIYSALSTVDDCLAEARRRSATGHISNRFQHLATFVGDLRDTFRKGDAYDLFEGH